MRFRGGDGVSRRVQAWVEQQLSAAEHDKACLAVNARRELRRMRNAASAGIVIEVAPSVFARTSYWNELKPAGKTRHVMRALQRLNPEWTFAGPSAAVGFGLSVSNRYLDGVWVATTRKAHQRRLAYRRPIVVSGDVTVLQDDLRLTSFERTIGDCLRIMDFRSGLALADSALRVSGWSHGELMAGVEHACARMPGIAKMRHLVALADARSESGGESIARATMLELGIAPPDLQRSFGDPVTPGRPYRVDFAWSLADKFILGELDGFEKYMNEEMTKGRSVAQVLEEEHRRQSHIEANPEVLRVVRFGFSDVMDDRGFLDLLLGCGVPRTFASDVRVQLAGGLLRCR